MNDEQKQKLVSFIRDWLYDYSNTYDGDEECLYALSRQIARNPALPEVSLVELRKLYDIEKENAK